MAFDAELGTLLLADGLRLQRGSVHGDLARDGRAWEPWLHYRDEPVGYRWGGHDAHHREALLLIVLFWPDAGPLREWHLAPRHLLDGAQARRDGPRTRALRDWFVQRHGAQLPCAGPWGEIDAAHDPHNLSSTILCRYAAP